MCPACYFYYDFSRFSPQVHHYPVKRMGNVMTVVSGSDCERGFHQQGVPKGLLEGRELMEHEFLPIVSSKLFCYLLWS